MSGTKVFPRFLQGGCFVDPHTADHLSWAAARWWRYQELTSTSWQQAPVMEIGCCTTECRCWWSSTLSPTSCGSCTHRPHNSASQLSHVGVGGVYWA